MIFIPEGWRDFELLDSGDYQKLERFGQYIIARPDPRAIWKKGNAELWKKADAIFQENEEWEFRNDPPDPWEIGYEGIRFALKPTSFKHTGVFPEQALNWNWIKVQTNSNSKILNLFAYTGGATMAAAKAGAQVTHVDASKPAMMWASENARLSGIAKDKIRWIQEDALKFVQREIRRGAKYDGIIMDPPRFGRGAGGEIWKLEEGLPELVRSSVQLLSETPLFFLLNAYTADLSRIALENLLTDYLKEGKLESGELGLKQSSDGRILPAGIFARWSNK